MKCAAISKQFLDNNKLFSHFTAGSLRVCSRFRQEKLQIQLKPKENELQLHNGNQQQASDQLLSHVQPAADL